MNSRRNGVALVIVLALIVLLAGIVVALLSHATDERRISSGSTARTRADLLARSALHLVVGDLKREIELRSTPDSSALPVIYMPNPPSAIAPERNGRPGGAVDPVPNLVRLSIRNDPVRVPSQASFVNSANDPSMNGRSVSPSRWNAHYLIPKLNAGNDAPDPVPGFSAPDWVFMTRSGPAIKSDMDIAGMRDPCSPDFLIGRYAYAIYDEGGLLDMNAAGFPGLPNPRTAAKGSLAFADPGALPAAVSANALNDILGWRNYATLQATGDFGKHNFSFAAANDFSHWALNNSGDFLRVSRVIFKNQTDQAFVGRRQLIKLRRSLGFNVNALQYLGTFGRDYNLPTLPRAIPLRVKTFFVRRDGSGSNPGEPLLHRFALARLDDLKNMPPAHPGQVQRDFGLVAFTGSDNASHWGYCGVSGSNIQNRIDDGWSAAGNREPNFFELIAFGLGEGCMLPRALEVGAKILDQFDADTAKTRIAYKDSAGNLRFAEGSENSTSLNRPFPSTGELRYAAGTNDELLDLFCAGGISDESPRLRGGIVNRNTHNPGVLAAILSGAYKSPANQAGLLKAADALKAANKIGTGVSSRGSGLGAITASPGDAMLVSRALADVLTVRTWTLMIDMIAQSGRYPPSSSRLSQFVVEGECRYWLHVSLDRFTGRILDEQLEVVAE